MTAPSSGRQETPSVRRVPHLDFFRGLALLTIFVNHIPLNELSNFTFSRFGFSDSAELFVFLSGYVAALVYGRYIRQVGLGLGSIAIGYRCIQLYAAHLGLFLVIAGICVAGKNLGTVVDYLDYLHMHYFFDSTQDALLELLSLTYLPNFFDILPLYIVLLLWVPVVCWLAGMDRRLALLFPWLLYIAMWAFHLELPAEPQGDRSWFFNPFGWQLIFFTGFALASGWIAVPGRSRLLFSVCLVLVLLAIPLGHEPTYRAHSWMLNWRDTVAPLLDKSHFGLLRWLHFLALAYLANYVLAGREAWLYRPLARVLTQLGRQSLPVFLAGMVLSHLGGMILFNYGARWLPILLVNGAGFLILGGVAYGLAWLEGKPWKRREPASSRPAGAHWGELPARILQTGSALALVAPLIAIPLLVGLHRPAAVNVVAQSGAGDEWDLTPLPPEWTLGEEVITTQELLDTLESL